jgi:hypothetical protein
MPESKNYELKEARLWRGVSNLQDISSREQRVAALARRMAAFSIASPADSESRSRGDFVRIEVPPFEHGALLSEEGGSATCVLITDVCSCLPRAVR